MKVVFTFLGLVFSFIGLSQTGPAGVGSSATNNLWVDANALNSANGNSVSVFNDLSGNGNDFTQLSSSAQPTFVASAVNGLPAILFDGNDDVMLTTSIPAIESAQISWFAVYKKASLDRQGIIGGNYASNPRKWVSYCNANNNLLTHGFYNGNSLTYNRYSDNGTNFNFFGNIVSPTNIRTYDNGTLKGTRNVSYTAPTGHNFVSLGRFPTLVNSVFHNGHIAEAFIFNYAVNPLERVLIENYLGAKYGITIPTDLYAFEATHNIGVIGIGNNGSNTQTACQGAGVVEISNPSAMVSGEYLLTGHTNIELTALTTSDLPAAISSHSRWERTWRVDETGGDVGNIDMVFDMSGTNGFGFPGTYRLLIDDDGNFTNATVISGTYNSLNDELTFTVNLADGDYFTISGVNVPPVAIRSVQTGNWFAGSTWDCGCIPGGSDTVYVENGDTVSVDGAGSAPVYNLYVESGARLNMVQPVELSINGNLTINGLLDATDGTIEFAGTIDQVFDGGGLSHDLNNVSINNGSIDTVKFENGDFNLTNTLSPLSGTMEIDPTATFVVKSTSSSTQGRVGIVFPNFTQTGDLTVERFIPSGSAGNRNLASPLIGSDLSEWDDSLFISGLGFPDGCANDSNGCYYSVKKYQGGLFDSTFIDVTNPNEVLLSTVGYEVYMGDDLSTFSGATLINTGTLNSSADIAVIDVAQGWHLFGNPYVSPISFQSLSRTRVGNYFYVFDAASGSYQWYDGSNNTSSILEFTDGKLATGQAFWAYANTSTANELKFMQSAKISLDATFVRNSAVENALSLTLKEDNSTYYNVISLAFNDKASDESDDLDINYMITGKQKASSMFMNVDNSTKKLTKNYLKSDNGSTKSVDFTIDIKRESYYTIVPSRITDLQDYEKAYLVDNELNEVIDLGVEGTYTFFSKKGQFDRFTIILTNETISNENIVTTPTSDNIVEKESNIEIKQLGSLITLTSQELLNDVSVDVTNVLGQKIISNYQINDLNGDQLINLENHLSGMYIVVVREAGVVVATKKIIL